MIKRVPPGRGGDLILFLLFRATKKDSAPPAYYWGARSSSGTKLAENPHIKIEISISSALFLNGWGRKNAWEGEKIQLPI